jgi:hypothetical protein
MREHFRLRRSSTSELVAQSFADSAVQYQAFEGSQIEDTDGAITDKVLLQLKAREAKSCSRAW